MVKGAEGAQGPQIEALWGSIRSTVHVDLGTPSGWDKLGIQWGYNLKEGGSPARI